MLVILFVITIILFLFIGIKKIKTFSNPLSIYLIFWGLWIIISLFNPYDLYPVSSFAYLLVWVNIFSFSIGFLVISKKKKYQINIEQNLLIIKERSLFFAEIILLIILIYYNKKYFALLSYGNIGEARRIRFELGYLFGNYTEYLLYNYFVISTLYLTIIINILKFILDKKINASLVITIVNILLFASIGLGRFVIFDFIVFAILGVVLTKKKSKNFLFNTKRGKYKSLVKYFFLLIAGVFVMTLITSFRYGRSIQSFEDMFFWLMFSVQQGMIYFLGPFRAFDSFLNLNPHTTYGLTVIRSTFSGLEEIINNIFILAGISINTANSIMSSFTVDSIVIGFNGQSFNAFYTGLTNFYLDGGISYIFIIPFLFGMIVAKIWNTFNEEPNFFMIALLIFIVKTTLAYQYRWDFSSPSNWIIFAILVIFYKVSKKRIYY